MFPFPGFRVDQNDARPAVPWSSPVLLSPLDSWIAVQFKKAVPMAVQFQENPNPLVSRFLWCAEISGMQHPIVDEQEVDMCQEAALKLMLGTPSSGSLLFASNII